ncbi:hypothetical protein FRB95_005244 [Tulasnella sp. JGI-2019a]|nr:hypothetical protein FRB95_005244 [Tulasnella sp. JGI-2019a]
MVNCVKKMACWEECGGDNVRLPIGPWGQDEHERLVGEKMRDVVLALSQAIRPVLLSEGHASNVVDDWIAKSLDELRSQERELYINFHFVWAIKAGKRALQ